ncbi:hypothetical protein JQ621_22410 [Bradyrhizobium manausense]|uniref:hypothetical protein n=1 Tax=Bradyrhizobium manausense TaxID=989370 RepID=UPI00201108B0|nr:hypothetical protein [Bradyrhizobium manausense]MBR1090228.1 hypothetical protein [Bradyrhizobium manausense]
MAAEYASIIRHRRFGAAEKPRAELNASGAIDLVADATLLQHHRCCDELIEERRLGVAEWRGSRRCRRDQREQYDD